MDELDNTTSSNTTTMGGRKHKHSGKRHGNASLRSWVAFVKKVQKEEHLPYKQAMMRAKVRKDKGEKWRGGAVETSKEGGQPIVKQVPNRHVGGGDGGILAASSTAPITAPTPAPIPTAPIKVGGRRRTQKRRGSKKRRQSRRR